MLVGCLVVECVPASEGLPLLARMVAGRAGWEEAARAVEILVRELEYTGWGLRAALDAVDMVVCIEELSHSSAVTDGRPGSLPV